MRLVLTRHGRTAWNQARRFQGQTDIELDDVGRAQALALAGVLRGRIEAVVASDLARAAATAQIVADALQIPVLGHDPDLRERGNGVFEGLTHEECAANYPDAWAAREGRLNLPPPGGETHAQVVERMQRALSRVVARWQSAHASVLVVSHGGALRMFLELVDGAPHASLGNAECHEVVHDGAGFVRAR
jgi:broad specificity phosphatase PhoE